MVEPIQRKLYLVRHAESAWNSERRVQGTCLDVPLSAAGRVQAELLGKRLRLLEAAAFYSSDARRAVETARIALGDGRDFVADPALRELSLGEWEGRLIADLRRETPEKIEAWYRKPSSVPIAGAENLAEFRRRVVGTIDRILAAHGTKSIAAVTHGGVICSYLTWILGMDVDDIWSFSLPNASITTIVIDFKPRLRSFGDTAHLERPPSAFDGIPTPS